jgi:hypothetical protein
MHFSMKIHFDRILPRFVTGSWVHAKRSPGNPITPLVPGLSLVVTYFARSSIAFNLSAKNMILFRS